MRHRLVIGWFVPSGLSSQADDLQAARDNVGPVSDLTATLCISCAGFGAGMLCFDAFSFVHTLDDALSMHLHDLQLNVTLTQ